jgi:hypothetical protein
MFTVFFLVERAELTVSLAVNASKGIPSRHCVEMLMTSIVSMNYMEPLLMETNLFSQPGVVDKKFHLIE